MDLNRKIHDPSSSIQDRFDKMDRMAQELTRRAESAEDTLRTLMDVGADFDIPRRRSIDFQTENVNPIGIAAVRPIDSIDDVAPRTKVDFSKFPSEYGTLMPSELSLLELRKSNDTAQKYFEEFSRNQNPILEFGPNDNFVHYDYNVRPDGLKQLQNPPVPKKSIKSKGKSKSGTTRSVGTKEGAAPSLSSGKRKISSTPKGSSESIDSKSAGTSRRTSRNHNLSLGSEYGYNPEPKAHTRKSPPTRCVSLTPSEKPRPVRSSSQPVLPSRSSQYGKNSVYTPPVTGPRSISSSSSRVLTQTKKSTIERNSTFNSENNGMKCRTPGKTGHHTPSQPSSATRLGTKKNSTPVHRPGRGLGSSAVISDISGRYKLQVRHTM